MHFSSGARARCTGRAGGSCNCTANKQLHIRSQCAARRARARFGCSERIATASGTPFRAAAAGGRAGCDRLPLPRPQLTLVCSRQGLAVRERFPS
jgi:hypothetical protein